MPIIPIKRRRKSTPPFRFNAKQIKALPNNLPKPWLLNNPFYFDKNKGNLYIFNPNFLLGYNEKKNSDYNNIILNKKPDFKFFLNNIYLYYISFIPIKNFGYNKFNDDNNNSSAYYNNPKYIYTITDYCIKEFKFIVIFSNVFWLGFYRKRNRVKLFKQLYNRNIRIININYLF